MDREVLLAIYVLLLAVFLGVGALMAASTLAYGGMAFATQFWMLFAAAPLPAAGRRRKENQSGSS